MRLEHLLSGALRERRRDTIKGIKLIERTAWQRTKRLNNYVKEAENGSGQKENGVRTKEKSAHGFMNKIEVYRNDIRISTQKNN